MATPAVDADGDTPMPTTEVDAPAGEEASARTITDEQHRAMKDVLEYVYDYRTPEGHDPSKLFHKRVNKRFLPDYYEVIKEPQAMSNIRQQLRKYNTVEEYIRDWALICHNAQLYNRPDAGAYHDALTVKALVETELKKFVDSGVFTAEQVAFPFLGDIPHADEIIIDEGAAEDETSESDDTDDEAGKRKGRGKARKQGTDGEKDEAARIAEIEARKKRGRPPRVDTPTEARIKNVLKAMRRSKNADGQYRILSFDRLPDKAVMPGYYTEITNPMAVDILKKKLKRKKYTSVEQFMQDVELMFENAKRFNEDESQIYKDAVALHNEARKLAAEEQNKPDTEYVMDEGRIPIPEGILHNGELYKVGDWVHIQNANDLTKPIVTQIYRTWKDAAGQKFVNVCWYYRPEQTVHRFDKYFFSNEVVKTGQYRDHSIEEIVNRCFVMFITRYNKGRPRGYPTDKEIYVCESRYNEEKLTFNKIKTWASCLPDEVRDKDYEMELYQEPKKMKKFPSPIAYLLKDTQKESDDLPKPEWGADNAPPKIGAVHKRPRDPRDSLPPEPTPPPPPRRPTPPPQPRQVPPTTSAPLQNFRKQVSQSTPSQAMNTPQTAPSFPNLQDQLARPTASPAPGSARPLAPQRNSSYNASSTPQPSHNLAANTSYAANTQTTRSFAPNLPHSSSNTNLNSTYSNISNIATYKAPQPIETWSLHDAANNNIPPDIRDQFLTDDQGRVLFFTAPPVEFEGGSIVGGLGGGNMFLDGAADAKSEGGELVGHSSEYTAWKLRNKADREKARKKRRMEEREEREGKRVKRMAETQEAVETARNGLLEKTMGFWAEEMERGTEELQRALQGERGMDRE